VNYKGGCTFVIPSWIENISEGEYNVMNDIAIPRDNSYYWFKAMINAERTYVNLSEYGWSPQEARSVLPNSTKTEIVATANFREWKHIFNLRCSKKAHPQMREIMIPLRDHMRSRIPTIFDD